MSPWTLGATESGPGARTPHLARGLDPLPDAEVADDPGKQEAEGQLPAQGPQVVDAGADAQNTSPADGETHNQVRPRGQWPPPSGVLILRADPTGLRVHASLPPPLPCPMASTFPPVVSKPLAVRRPRNPIDICLTHSAFSVVREIETESEGSKRPSELEPVGSRDPYGQVLGKQTEGLDGRQHLKSDG